MKPPPTTHRGVAAPRRTRLPLVLLTNLGVALCLLVAVPVIYNGQQNFLQHSTADRNYVEAAIGSGEADFIHNALRTTEVARAMAHDDHVATMAVMQLTIAFLSALFFFNGLYLLRLHRRSRRAPVGPAKW